MKFFIIFSAFSMMVTGMLGLIIGNNKMGLFEWVSAFMFFSGMFGFLYILS